MKTSLKIALHAQSRRERAFVREHPKALAILLFVISGCTAIILRSNGLIGQIAWISMGSVAILCMAALGFLAVRTRLRHRETQDKIDLYLTQRTRPPVHFKNK